MVTVLFPIKYQYKINSNMLFKFYRKSRLCFTQILAAFSSKLTLHNNLSSNFKNNHFPLLSSKKNFDIHEKFGKDKNPLEKTLSHQSLRTISILIEMATNFTAKRNSSQASECLSEALKKLETITDKNSQKALSLYKEIGILYYKIKDLQKLILYCQNQFLIFSTFGC